MNTTTIADSLAEKFPELSKAKAKELVGAVLAGITEAALRGEEVSLPGFGKFKVQDKPARTARNPKTGEAIEVAASKKLAFQPAKTVKDALNGVSG
ncbi:MAG: HU family DNA-binding protein [Caulobacteraceae bacterium]